MKDRPLLVNSSAQRAWWSRNRSRLLPLLWMVCGFLLAWSLKPNSDFTTTAPVPAVDDTTSFVHDVTLYFANSSLTKLVERQRALPYRPDQGTASNSSLSNGTQIRDLFNALKRADRSTDIALLPDSASLIHSFRDSANNVYLGISQGDIALGPSWELLLYQALQATLRRNDSTIRQVHMRRERKQSSRPSRLNHVDLATPLQPDQSMLATGR